MDYGFVIITQKEVVALASNNYSLALYGEPLLSGRLEPWIPKVNDGQLANVPSYLPTP